MEFRSHGDKDQEDFEGNSGPDTGNGRGLYQGTVSEDDTVGLALPKKEKRMRKRIVMVLLIGLCVLGGLFAQGTKEEVNISISTNPFPYLVVVNETLVPDSLVTVTDILVGRYWGEILVPASLKAELIAFDPAFRRDVLSASDIVSVIDAVAVQEFAIGIIPFGTRFDKALPASVGLTVVSLE